MGASIRNGLGLAAVAAALVALLLAPSAGHAAKSNLGITYDLDGTPTPTPAKLNQLDLYQPADVTAGAARPVVVYVHGGGWSSGDKDNKISRKVNLFTGAGYVFASVNYRLSPDPIDLSYPASRVRFPTHPGDVGEAIAWLDRNVASYGGDPRRILLIGHSAGAHIVSLISTDPSYVARWGVDPSPLPGTVSPGAQRLQPGEGADLQRHRNARGERRRRELGGGLADRPRRPRRPRPPPGHAGREQRPHRQLERDGGGARAGPGDVGVQGSLQPRRDQRSRRLPNRPVR